MPRIKFNISKSHAKTVRSYLGYANAKEVVDEAKAENRMLSDKYDELKLAYDRLKNKESKKSRKSNGMKQKKYLDTLVNEIIPPKEDIDEASTFFVKVSLKYKATYKISGNQWSPWTEETANVEWIFPNVYKRHVYDNVLNKARETYNYENSDYRYVLIENSIKYTITNRDAFTPKVKKHIRQIGMKRANIINYQFMPKISEISKKTSKMNCVLSCLVERYSECRKPLSKEQILDDMESLYDYEDGMEDTFEEYITENGVSADLVFRWCKKRDITCYCFDHKNKLFDKFISGSRNRPPLLFYSVDEHMYMIDDKKTIESIVKRHADTKHVSNKTFWDEQVVHEKENLLNSKIIDYFEGIDFDTIDADVIMVQTSNLWDIFAEFFKNGQIPWALHKGDNNIKCIRHKRHDKVIKIMADAMFETKGLCYKDVMNICAKINMPFTNQGMSLIKTYFDKYRGVESKRTPLQREAIFAELGKSCCRCGSCESLEIDHIKPLSARGTNIISNLQILCKQCHFEKTSEERNDNSFLNVDPMTSTFNNEVNKVFQSDLMMRWSFTEKLSDLEAKFGYDINKCRKNNLYYSKYDFQVYTVMDDIRPFSGKIQCGQYKVETKQGFPMRGNGWCSEPMIRYALEMKYIVLEDIKFELIPSLKIPKEYFREFIDHIYTLFPNHGKLCINALIGCFFAQNYKQVTSYYTRSFDESSWLYTEYNGASAFYDKNIDGYKIQFEETFMVQSTEAPIYFQILDEEAIEADKLRHIVGGASWVKTDCIYSENEVDISKYEWAKGVPKYKKEEVCVTGIEKLPRMIRKDKYVLKSPPFNIITDSEIEQFVENDTFETMIKKFEPLVDKVMEMKSVNIDGRAGVGKSLLVHAIKERFDKEGIKYQCLAPTNKASININGQTIHKFVGKNCQRLSRIKHLVKKLDAIILDEVSMLQELYLKVLNDMKKINPKLRLILVGDYNQLLPVKDRVMCDYSKSGVLFELVCGNKISLEKCRRSDDILFNICKDVENIDLNVFGNKKCMKNVCYTNVTRDIVNKECMKIFSPGKKCWERFCVGCPIISTKNSLKIGIVNNEEFEIAKINKDDIEIIGSEGVIVIPKEEFSRIFELAFCITIHKSQGATFKEDYAIYEWDKMKGDTGSRLKYVALSRGTNIKNINIIR